jgi:pimeloyl-ACP methyl ester carboxylesterase
MKKRFYKKVLVSLLLCAVAASANAQKARTSKKAIMKKDSSGQTKVFEQTFAHRTAEVNGVKIHYVIGGTGEPLVLIHGYPYTWATWRKVMPALAEKYTVIAPDMRGMGESDKPAAPEGYLKHVVAEDIYQLVKQLGYEKINLVGHDIGMMVAYSYAAAHPEAVKKLVLAETSGVPGFGFEDSWDTANGGYYHFAFHSDPLAEELTKGNPSCQL